KSHPSLCDHQHEDGGNPMDAVCRVARKVSLSSTVHRAYASFDWYLKGSELFLLLSFVWLVFRASDHSTRLTHPEMNDGLMRDATFRVSKHPQGIEQPI